MKEKIKSLFYLSAAWLLLLSGLTHCNSGSTENPTENQTAKTQPGSAYSWEQVMPEAPWPKSYNFQVFNFRDTLRVFHPHGNWESADGIHWQPSPLPNPIGNHAFLDYVAFKEAIWGLGEFKGNIEKYEFHPYIFRTGDGKTMDNLSRGSNFPLLFFNHPFVFRDSLWIIGGDSAEGKSSAAVYNSADAVHWNLVKNSTAMGPRSSSQIVLLNDTLYLLNDDVWSSTDAREWKRVTDEIVKGEKLFGYQALVWKNEIWLLGCNRNGQFTSEVLHSADGKHWKEMKAPWSPRGGIAAAVFNDEIWMTGGKYGGTPDHIEFIYSNDLWRLKQVPADSSRKN